MELSYFINNQTAAKPTASAFEGNVKHSDTGAAKAIAKSRWDVAPKEPAAANVEDKPDNEDDMEEVVEILESKMTNDEVQIVDDDAEFCLLL